MRLVADLLSPWPIRNDHWAAAPSALCAMAGMPRPRRTSARIGVLCSLMAIAP